MELALLLGGLARGAIVLGVAWVAARVLRRSAAELRFGLWRAALLGLLVLPLVGRVAPALALPIVFERPSSASASAATAGAVEPEADAEWTTGSTASASAALDPTRLALLLWASGALGLLGLHLVRMGLLVRLARRGTPADARLAAELGRARACLGSTRRVRLVLSDGAVVPFALDGPRPTIVLPWAAFNWDADALRAVLRHELVHLVRRDGLVHTLVALACALHWIDPLVWIARARWERERERSCDDRVLALGERPSEYARQLLALVAGASPRGAPALGRGTEVGERVRALLDPSVSRRARRGAQRATWVGAAALVTLLAGARSVHPPGAGDPTARARELSALGARATLEPAALETLFAALSDERALAPELRRSADEPLRGSLPDSPGKEAARVLAARGPAHVPRLLAVLEAEAPAARQHAAWALGCIGARDTAAALARRLELDREARVRRIAAWALGEMRARAGRAALERALGDREPAVRAQAAHSLGDLGDRRALAPLVAALRDPEASVRERAAHALGDLADERAASALRAALEDPDPDARSMARWALDRTLE